MDQCRDAVRAHEALIAVEPLAGTPDLEASSEADNLLDGVIDTAILEVGVAEAQAETLGDATGVRESELKLLRLLVILAPDAFPEALEVTRGGDTVLVLDTERAPVPLLDEQADIVQDPESLPLLWA